jgi:glycosyltransferase involved in cell wall biosynthesis
MAEVHLFEPSGYAGVFQHVCRLAQLLGRAGIRVVVHTGHEHEQLPGTESLEMCGCSWWPRHQRRGLPRSAAITGRYVGRTLPHLRAAAPRGSIVHLQGIAASGVLNATTLLATRLAGRRAVYSPHDAFSRRGSIDDAFLRVALRIADGVIVHTRPDAETLGRAGIIAHYSPLVQVVPAADDVRRRRWRQEWRAAETDQVVLFAGWIRPEKRLDLVIESARRWPSSWRLAVVGQDRGGWESCATLARRRGVNIAARLEFVDLEDFTAAISAADVIVAPHERASQSGVLSLARQLGVPAVAADVGGLGELATGTFPSGDVDGLTNALDMALAHERPRPLSLDEKMTVESHLRAYGMTERGG